MNRRLVLAAMLACVSCSRYEPAATYQHAWTPVRVVFTVPREVISTSPSGDSTLHADVSEIRGSFIMLRADSVHIRVTNIRQSSGAFDDPPSGSTAAVRLDSATRFEARHGVGGESGTVGAVLLVAGLIGLALVLVAFNEVLDTLRKNQ